MDIIPLSLVYPINARVYKNVLLIDSEVKDAQLFASSANDDTFPVIYSSRSTKTELSALLKTKFPNSIERIERIERIGVVFTSNGGIIKTFLDSNPFFTNEEQWVSPYSENVDFIISVLRDFNVKNIDYLACDTLNYPNWNRYYDILKTETGVVVGASSDKTGNIKYGGDWVMESTSQDIELIYFTKSIEYYSYLLDSGASFVTMLLDVSNNIWGTGINAESQLGIGNYYSPIYVLTPATIPYVSGVPKIPKYISCGESYTAVLMNDASIYVTGLNNYGQFGNGSTSQIRQTVLIQMTNNTGKTPKYISCGARQMMVLMTDGTIYGCGYNAYGQLGIINDTVDKLSLSVMTNTTGRIPKYIRSFYSSTAVLMTDGTIWGTGYNFDGQLGIGTTQNVNTTLQKVFLPPGKTPKYISCGGNTMIVLMMDGTIWGCGLNAYGQLGIGSTASQTILTQMIIPSGKTPKYVSGGARHTMVLMTDGTVWGTGANWDGQLGLGNTTNVYVSVLTQMTNATSQIPTNILGGNATTVVLMANGSAWATGYGDYGQLGDWTVISKATLTRMKTSSTNFITNIVGGMDMTVTFDESIWHHTVVFDVSMNIYGTGYSEYGQLGFWNSPPYNVTTLVSVPTPVGSPKYIALGKMHTIVLMVDGNIWVTGNNWYGQLGIDVLNNPIKTSLTKIPNISGETPKYIACGEYYTIVLMTDGTIWGTGANWYGQLGVYNTDNTMSLTQMTNNTGKTPRYISCGGSHTMVLMTDGTIWGTGLNTSGQLGIASSTYPTNISLTQMTNNTGKTPKYISCGSNHTIVLMTDGTIWGTGLNTSGELGLGNTTNVSVLAQMTNNTGKTPKYISCGANHTIVLMTDASGSVYGTGYNVNGQLGLMNTTNVSVLTQMTILYPPSAVIAYIANMNIVDDTPSSDICFPAGTPILTDQGIIVIEMINPDIHTINNKPIIDITKTISHDTYLVEFKKDALELNCPTENTRMSQKHRIYHNGEMCEARTFLGKFEKVVKVKYNGEVLYNVLMDNSSLMLVNNLICETLNPNNIIAKLFTRKCRYTYEERDKIYELLTYFLTKSDHKSYNKISEIC